MNPLSVILHCDLDCFYAQVERERLGLPKDAAVAVVQWSSALAVSYPARVYGIKRGSTVEDIRRLDKDSNVTIVHVETISTTNPTQQQQPQQQQPNIQTKKVSLARYRNASVRVFAVMSEQLSKLHQHTVFEKASIDEAYIDVTAEVDRRIRSGVPVPPFSSDTYVESATKNSVTTQGEPHSEDEEEMLSLQQQQQQHDIPVSNDDLHDARLAHGAAIAFQLRQRVASVLGYTMSAGISVNKLTAKFASASHKPNRQTVVPITAISYLLCDVPLSKIRGLGGKLGRTVSQAITTASSSPQQQKQNAEIATAGQVRKLSLKQLQRILSGDEASAMFVFRSVRGMDDTPVTKRDAPRSLLAAKSFTPVSDLSLVKETWLPLLASELVQRLQEDGRMATTLTLSFRATHTGSAPFVSASRSMAMPSLTASQMEESIVQTAGTALHTVFHEQHSKFKLPINFVGLTATNFVQRAHEREQISHFFSEKGSSVARVDMGTQQQKQNMQQGDPREAHRRRLQEKADRDLALKLHRQETLSGGVRKKSGRKSESPPASSSKSKTSAKTRRGNQKKDDANGVAKLDRFFKPVNKSSNKP